jgi:nucleotide-binding universal stress UspA family protein
MEAKIVTLVVLSYEKAQMLQLMLEGEGIECFLEHQNLIQGAVSTGVNVNIKETDVEKALPLLEGLIEAKLEQQEASSDSPNTNRILLPIDFSTYSRTAADFALEWAQQLSAEITVFHTYYSPVINTLPFSDTFIYDMNLDEMGSELKEKAEEQMNEFKEYLDTKNKQLEHPVNLYFNMVKGIAEEEIVRFSKSYNPLVIIMGTRGIDRKSSDLIGSVTAEVIDMAKVPVLAIPEDFDYQGLSSFKNVLYATNFDESDFIALDTLEKILRPLGVKIICAHVDSPLHSKWDEVRMDGLKEHLRKTYNETDVVCDLITNEDFWVGIEGFVRENNINMISLTTHKRNIISRMLNPSIAKKMLFHSTTPLLVFHA